MNFKKKGIELLGLWGPGFMNTVQNGAGGGWPTRGAGLGVHRVLGSGSRAWVEYQCRARRCTARRALGPLPASASLSPRFSSRSAPDAAGEREASQPAAESDHFQTSLKKGTKGREAQNLHPRRTPAGRASPSLRPPVGRPVPGIRAIAALLRWHPITHLEVLSRECSCTARG